VDVIVYITNETCCTALKKSCKLLNQMQGNPLDVIFLKCIISVRGGHCDYLTWVPKYPNHVTASSH
jgi:hypothetical protein